MPFVHSYLYMHYAVRARFIQQYQTNADMNALLLSLSDIH
jgi:hypothetical protein